MQLSCVIHASRPAQWPAVCFLLLLMGMASLRAESWEKLPAIPAEAVAGPAWVRPEKFQAVRFQPEASRAALQKISLQTVARAVATERTEISLPMPDGTTARFRVEESPVMAPELAALFPEIKTYAGTGVDDPAATVRFDQTPAGFHAQILSPHGAVYIDPYNRGDNALHVSYYKRDYAKGPDGFRCLVTETKGGVTGITSELLPSGTSLRTYRLACAATAEYTQFHGGTVAGAMAAIVTAVNRVSGIYEAEVAVRLQLVANNQLLVFTNAATDPFNNTNGFVMLDQNQTTVSNVIGSANYDLGHVFSTGGGGVAGLGVVCNHSSKARGVTGSPAPVGDAFYVDYVAHEMGHQFGANHTFNSSTLNCGGGNRNAATAYEPGSGSTIMAYAGICGADDLQPNSDPYFHSASLDEITTFLGGTGGSCPVTTATGNTVPTVNAGIDYIIPKGTPFTLTASGQDNNGDVLTYCWEERDLGNSLALTGADNGTSPLFRSFSPTTNVARTFPKISTLLANTGSLAEKLPAVARTMNFRVIVRDGRAGGGGAAADNMVVTVRTNGPFVLTSPNTAVTWSDQQTVTWNVADTDKAPISAARVNLLLSTNGGLTFPVVLASNTLNDGSELVQLPNEAVTNARIKVAAVSNIFFDLSDVNFRLTNFVPKPRLALEAMTLLQEGCAPTNNRVDANEFVTMGVMLRNTGLGAASNVQVRLLSLGTVSFNPVPTQAGYGAIGPGFLSAALPLEFTAAGTCGMTAPLVVEVRENGTNFSYFTNLLTLGIPVTNDAVFARPEPVLIPPSIGIGSAMPYPAVINVTNLPGTIMRVMVTFSNLTHTSPDDMDVLLTGPDGTGTVLMSDAGGSQNLTNTTLVFDTAATTLLPDSSLIAPGTYAFTDYFGGDAYSAPAPGGSFNTAKTNYLGKNPNGTWSLYIMDDANPNNLGMLGNGWSLRFVTAGPGCCVSPNQPPFLSSLPNRTILQNTLLNAMPFAVADPETPASNLVLTATSSNEGLVTTADLTLGGSGHARTLTAQPWAQQTGITTITIGVNDGQTNVTASFQLEVVPIPSLSATVVGNQVAVSWPAVAGLVYRLQVSTNLAAGNWQEAGLITATNSGLQVLETPGTAAKFFRLAASPE